MKTLAIFVGATIGFFGLVIALVAVVMFLGAHVIPWLVDHLM